LVHVSYYSINKKNQNKYFDFLNLDLRRDTYEDYTFPLTTVSNDTNAHGFELFSLRNYAKHYGKKKTKQKKKEELKFLFIYFLASLLPKERYAAAVKELRFDANTHYHTVIRWGTGFEIIATALVLVVTALTYILATPKSEDI
jgi:hypothetical protein